MASHPTTKFLSIHCTAAMCFGGEMRGIIPPTIFDITRKLVKCSAMLQVAVFCDLLFFLLIKVVGQMLKMPPSQMESASAHLCCTALTICFKLNHYNNTIFRNIIIGVGIRGTEEMCPHFLRSAHFQPK